MRYYYKQLIMLPQLPNLKHTESGQFFLIAGPCAIEGKEMARVIARELVALSDEFKVPLIFKGSYKKANRTKIDSFTGIGDEKALNILAEIRKEFDIPVLTDVHTAQEAAMASKYVDVLQIPAFLCRQTELLAAAAATGKAVNIKKGQFMAPSGMKFAIEKVKHQKSGQVMLTERGTTFGYSDLVVDFRGIPEMQSFNCPVILDCTHSLQQPNQASGVTGGRPAMITTMAKAGVAVGVDGLFIETHPDPASAKSDGANMLALDKFRILLDSTTKIRSSLNVTKVLNEN